MQSEAVKGAVERIKEYLNRHSRSKNADPEILHNYDDKFLLLVADLNTLIEAAQSPASAVEVVTAGEIAKRWGAINGAAVLMALQQHPNGLKIAPLKSPEGV